jgi:hypothetical protein
MVRAEKRGDLPKTNAGSFVGSVDCLELVEGALSAALGELMLKVVVGFLEHNSYVVATSLAVAHHVL